MPLGEIETEGSGTSAVLLHFCECFEIFNGGARLGERAGARDVAGFSNVEKDEILNKYRDAVLQQKVLQSRRELLQEEYIELRNLPLYLSV